MTPDLRRLRYFVTVAEDLHFGRAATRLHLTTPPLSQRIRELEETLGLTLFERTSRRVALTPAGERLLIDARAVLAAMDRFSATAGELAAAPSALALGYCHGSERAAMLAIGAFHVSQPGAVVRADGLTSLRIVDSVRRGTLAAGIVRGPVPDPERVASKPLARVPVDHLAVPPAHPLAGADIVNASDLDGQPVLVVDRAEAPTGHDEIKAYCASVSARPNWITHAAVQVERVLDQVALGTGIGWLNAWQAEPAAGRPDIAVRRLQPVTLFDTYRVVWRTGDDAQTTAQFVQALVEASASLPTGREGANAGVP